MESYLFDGLSGTLWIDAVNSLMSLESVYGFKTQTKTLPTNKRPLVIGTWVANGRKETLPGVMKDMDITQVRENFVAWWNELQPAWRKCDPEWGRYQRLDWSKESRGDWGTLVCPGNNGIYSVLAYLSWWLRKHPGFTGDCSVASSEWKTLVSDVIWVMDDIQCIESHKVKKAKLC
jgi:hypothetical protein